MNKKLEKALAKPEILILGPVISPASKDKLPIHVTSRKLLSHPDSLWTIAKEMVKIIKKLKVNRIAGGETAGIPWATACSMISKIPMVYVRKEKRKWPRTSVEGIIYKGDKVVLLDDSFVSGEHKKIFIENIEQTGAKVKAIVVIADAPGTSKEKERQEFLKELKRKRIKVFSLVKWPEWFRILGKYGHLSPKMTEIAVDAASNVKDWQDNPKKWKWFEKVKREQKGKFT